jgi:predicted phosphodiesterase
MPEQTYTEEEILKMKERGIYTNPDEESFRSDKDIKREKAISGELPVFETPLAEDKGFHYWSQRFQERQEQYGETTQIRDRVNIRFPQNDILITFIADTHPGNPQAHYKRLEQEVETIINTPNSYAVLVGDLVDGFFFTPAVHEAMEAVPEQFKYMESFLKYLSANKKLLVGFGGDHDGWTKKMGIDPYAKFEGDLGAYYIHGVGHLTFSVGDIDYKLVGAHQLPGFSMYNNVHPQMRAAKEVQGADIYFSGHNHQKGHSEQAIKEFGGNARRVHYMALGPYKPTDEYSRKKGWAQQSPDEMYGASVILSANKKQVKYYYDIIEAHQLFVSS